MSSVIHWSETDLTEFFGVLGVYHEVEGSYSFTVHHEDLQLVFTIFSDFGDICVSLHRKGWLEPIIAVEQRGCSHAQIVREGMLRYLDVGSPNHAVSNIDVAPIIARGIRIQVEPQFSIRLL